MRGIYAGTASDAVVCARAWFLRRARPLKPCPRCATSVLFPTLGWGFDPPPSMGTLPPKRRRKCDEIALIVRQIVHTRPSGPLVRLTKLTSLRGTTIAWRISLPSSCAWTRGDAFACSISSASGRSADTSTRSRTLAVDLDHQLEGVALEQRLVGDRPRLLPEPLVPEPLPELLRDVRRIWLNQ